MPEFKNYRMIPILDKEVPKGLLEARTKRYVLCTCTYIHTCHQFHFHKIAIGIHSILLLLELWQKDVKSWTRVIH